MRFVANASRAGSISGGSGAQKAPADPGARPPGRRGGARAAARPRAPGARAGRPPPRPAPPRARRGAGRRRGGGRPGRRAPAAPAASNNPLLGTLVTAVGEAGLVDTLNDAEALTVFAPTDDAFGAIPEEDLNAVLAVTTTTGTNSVIQLDTDDSITLLGVRSSDLHDDDFLF